MHIFLTNDDGVLADGLLNLAAYLAKDHKITIVASEVEQSAKSHALTIEVPLRLHKRTADESNPMIYALTGTPTDCTKFGLSYLLKEDKPDLVISGVNNGFNLGSDVLYSGTVSAAMEAVFYGIPSLAVSVEKYSRERGKEIQPLISEVIDRIFRKGNFQGILNMNFPKEGTCTWDKIKVVRQGYQEYSNIIEERVDRRGRKYYWLGGTLEFPKFKYLTDVEAIKQGYVTLVPLTWQQEDRAGIDTLNKLI